MELSARTKALHSAQSRGTGTVCPGDGGGPRAVCHHRRARRPLAGDQSKVYLEGTLAQRWNPLGQQPVVADGARSKQVENIYGAIHLGTGEEVSSFVIAWQDSEATIRWLEQLLADHPQGQLLLWLDQARASIVCKVY